MYKLFFALLLAAAAGYFFFDLTNDQPYESTEIAESSEPLAEWKKFEPTSGKFIVKLPSIPQYAIDVVNVPNTDIKRWYEIYVAEQLDGSVYMINLITYHPDFDLSNTKELLHNVVNEVVSSNLNNHVIEIKDLTFEGRQAVSFFIKNQTLQVKGEAFLVGGTVYLLAYTGNKVNFKDNDYETFIKSFELLKDEKSGPAIEIKEEPKVEKTETEALKS